MNLCPTWVGWGVHYNEIVYTFFLFHKRELFQACNKYFRNTTINILIYRKPINSNFNTVIYIVHTSTANYNNFFVHDFGVCVTPNCMLFIASEKLF